LRLRRNAQGRGNWADFGQERAAESPAGGGHGDFKALTLAGIRITNGRLSYEDLAIEGFNVEAGAFGGDGPTAISLAFDLKQGPDELSLQGKFDVSADFKDKHVTLKAVNFSGLANLAGTQPPVHWEMSAPAMEVDLGRDSLSLQQFALGLVNAHVTGALQASWSDPVRATGSVSLAPVVLRELAPRLGVALPTTRDPKALKSLSARGDFGYEAGALRLTKLQAELDDTQLKGSVSLTAKPQAIKFDLNVDHIDVDRYLSPERGPAPAASTKPGAKAELPEADGTLSAGSLHFSPLDFTAVRLVLSSKSNVLHLYPVQAQIDGGGYSGNVTADLRGAVPLVSVDEHLSGVDVARLLASTTYKGRLSGRGNVNLKATARGAALDPVLQTLNGHFDANLADGALEGVDLGYEVGLAESLFKHTAQPVKSNPPRTRFDAFKMSSEITDGISHTKDLVISSPVLRVTGQGTANLASKAIEYQLLASVLKAPGSTLADIPVKVTGTYLSPTIRPDVEALAKGEVKQRLQDLLKKNGLEGLFGK
jgi:AsmA protein